MIVSDIGTFTVTTMVKPMERTNGPKHVMFDFNHESFKKIAFTFKNMKVQEKYELEEICVSVVEVTEYSDFIKFQLSDHNGSVGEVHVHIFRRVQSIMIQGDSGAVVGRKPFIAFSDFYLEPLFDRLINDNSGDEMSLPVKKKMKFS